MDAHENTPRIQVLSVSDTGRRRRWTDDEKVRIIKESHLDGMTLAEVARRHEISRSMLYDWRYRYKHGMLGCGAQFMRLVPMENSPSTEGVKWSGKFGQRAKVYPTRTNGCENDKTTEFFRPV